MIPWGAIAVVLWAATRNLDPNRPQVPAAVLVVVVRCCLAPVPCLFAANLPVGPFKFVAWSLALTVALLLVRPSLLLERFFIPRGFARAAYWWTFLTVPLPVLYDLRGGRSFYAARALLRQAPLDGEVASRVERVLTAPRKTQRTSLTIVAEALLSIARGSVDHGRVLLASLDVFEAPAVPSVARDVARSWLVADALSRADVDGALRLASGPGFSPWPALVRLEIERARGAPRTWRDALRRGALWALAPARGVTWRFVARWHERSVTLPAETGDVLADALTVHRLLVLASPKTKGYVTALGEACRRWEIALASSALRARVERRCLGLDLPADASPLIDRFAAEVMDDLEGCAMEVDSPLVELDATALGERVRHAAREADCREIETLLDTFRWQTEGEFPSVHEAWALFARLRAHVEATFRRHPDARDLLALTLFRTVTNWNCRLYNEAREHALGRAVFRWLYSHAGSLPPHDLALAIKNARVAAH